MGNRLLTVFMVGGCASAALMPGLSEAAPGTGSEITVHQGLVFRQDAKLAMDLYLPVGAAEAVPCVIVIQGGGFRSQNGRRFRSFAVHLAEHGFAAALIAYRGRPDHTYEETISDVKSAVRYIRQVGSGYGIDRGRIGAMGRSAGATLAALLAVTDSMTEGSAGDGRSRFSSRIQAAVGLAGVYDFVLRFTDERQAAMQPRYDVKKESNGEWIGEPFSATGKRWQAASPITHVDGLDPPMLLIHCKNDRTVPWLQSQIMFDRMRKAGIAAELEVYETGGHGCKTEESPAPLDRMVGFFRSSLME